MVKLAKHHISLGADGKIFLFGALRAGKAEIRLLKVIARRRRDLIKRTELLAEGERLHGGAEISRKGVGRRRPSLVQADRLRGAAEAEHRRKDAGRRSPALTVRSGAHGSPVRSCSTSERFVGRVSASCVLGQVDVFLFQAQIICAGASSKSPCSSTRLAL